MKSNQEERYTSTGSKLWRHKHQMHAYRAGIPHTVVSTHVAPEGACNLKCPYCSVTHRDIHNRLDLEVIKDYLAKLQTRGLKAVILTGGGEPTIYPDFDQLVRWISGQGLKVALITNGTMTGRVSSKTWQFFEWVRVSINFFPGWTERIKLPLEHFHDRTVVGCSMVFTDQHELQKPAMGDTDLGWLGRFEMVSRVADRCGAHYIRVLPNCLLPEAELSASHKRLDTLLQGAAGDPRFFRQDKHHRAPSCGTCHQSYFRPYLSEECYAGSDTPGAVYPCDSVVLNDAVAKFTPTYQLCAPADILDYLDGRIGHQFDPRVDCKGCVFTDTVEMLDRWKATGEGTFEDEPMIHEEFV